MEKTSLSAQLSGKDDRTKANIKAEAHIAAVAHAFVENPPLILKSEKQGMLKFIDSKGRTLIVEDMSIGKLTPQGFIRSEKIANPVWFKVSVDGEYLNGDGWYGFVNPPIMVADGTYHEEYDELLGEYIKVQNFKEDIVSATKSIICQAVGGA